MKATYFFLYFFLSFPIFGVAQFESARQSMAVLDYEMAIEELEKIEFDGAEGIDRRQLLAQCYQAIGNYPAARKQRFEILNLDTFHLSSVLSLAQIYEREQNWPKSIKYHKRLLELDSTSAVYHYMYAHQLLKTKEILPAIIHSSMAYRISPDDVAIILLQAKMMIGIDSLVIADTILAKAISVYPENLALLKEIARVKYKQDLHSEVIEILDRAKKLVDLDDAYQKMLGFSYYEVDSFDLCISALSRLLDEIDEEHVHHYLARAFAQKEDFESADFHNKRAMKAGTSDKMDNYYLEKARLNEEEGKKREALDLYKKGYAHLDDARILLQLARLSDEYYKDKSIALRYYKKYLLHPTANPLLTDSRIG